MVDKVVVPAESLVYKRVPRDVDLQEIKRKYQFITARSYVLTSFMI